MLFQTDLTVKQRKSLDAAWPNVYVAMIDILTLEKEATFAFEVVTAMLNSKIVQEKNYLQYANLCKALNKKPDPKTC